MPIYEFTCPIHGRFERMFFLSDYDNIKDGILCNNKTGRGKACNQIATKEISETVYPSHGKPTTIFVNKKTGEKHVASYDGQKPLHGFVAEELKTPHERTKFENEMRKKQDFENQIDTEARIQINDAARKARHSRLNAQMNSITKDSENPAAAEALLKAAMNRSRKKKVPKKQLGFHLAVNHNDKNNLDKG